MKIEPIDVYCMAGFEKQIVQQFKCKVVWATGTDLTRTIEKMYGAISYPFIGLEILSYQYNGDSYGVPFIRSGITIKRAETGNQYLTAFIIPVKFAVQVTFVSNDANEMRNFVRTYMLNMVRKQLTFSIQYGSQKIGISYMSDDSVPIQQRTNVTESEPIYTVQATITVNGYMSDGELDTEGAVSDIKLSSQVGVTVTNSPSTIF